MISHPWQRRSTNYPRQRGFKIESVINNAGVLIKDLISDVSYADFEEQMRVNVWYALELFRALYNKKLLAPNAHILNLGSMGGVQGSMKFPGLFAYSASKAAFGRAYRVIGC